MPMIRLQPIIGIFLRQVYLVQEAPLRILPTFTAVAVDMVAWGFMTRYLNSLIAKGFDFVLVLMGAVLFWNFLMQIMQGVSFAFLQDLHSRNLLNLFATPLRISEYIFGLVAASIAISAAGLALMLTIATTVFGFPLWSLGSMLMPYLLVLFLFGTALGICASTLVLRLGPSFQPLVFAIPAVLSPFVGVLYPLATLPSWMRNISYALPPAYVFEDIRSLLKGHSVPSTSVSLAMILSAMYLFLAGFLFSEVVKYAIRSGTLARYSAQSGS